MLGVIDYNAGNIRSVQNALDQLNIPYFVSSNPKELEKATKILFPGVGHAKSAMQELQKRKLDIFLKNTNKPTLGICIGMQLLFDWTEEGETDCLGIIPGKVKKFTADQASIIPHMGWNEVTHTCNPLFQKSPQKTDFYFVHSYYCVPDNADHSISNTQYQLSTFCSAVEYKNYSGVQFHPEKSGEMGQHILQCFWEMEEETK